MAFTAQQRLGRMPGPYRPLHDGEIRVLCLEPGVFGSPLRGSFRYITLPDTHGKGEGAKCRSDVGASSSGTNGGFEPDADIQNQDNSDRTKLPL